MAADGLSEAPLWGAPSMLVGATLLTMLGLRLLHRFSQALRDAEAARARLEAKLHDIGAETGRYFTQWAELSVDRVTQQERRRIAADLHDDLGAKLLTIIHTCDNERIASLGREAIDEMRLSVRGLEGRPKPIGDAMADWRAEMAQRLAQAGIEVEWHALPEDVKHALSARAYVQITRMLRETVNNIIRHSGASRCEVRCFAAAGEYGLEVADNGVGLAAVEPGSPDRGQGLAIMQQRAADLSGRCRVETRRTGGTVVHLSFPL